MHGAGNHRGRTHDMTMTDKPSDLEAEETGVQSAASDDFWTRLLLRQLAAIEHGRLTMIMPDARILRFGKPNAAPHVTVTIHRRRTARRLALGGSLGFAEAFMEGDWGCSDLTELILLAIANERQLGLDKDGIWAVRMVNRIWHFLHRNSRSGSRRNIAYHYDLGNAFYRLWLDPSMTYSSALFEAPNQTLEAAQGAKNRQVAALLGLTRGERVLDIGCGWGGFAQLAAGEHGCNVTGITLSQEQHAYATARLKSAGLADRTEIRLQDYRDTPGSFDRIASIEMFEAVGEAHWPVYFERLRQLLAPGGVAVLQIITIAEERFAGYRAAPDFIQRYIFPGGMLPTRTILRQFAGKAGLGFSEGPLFARSYARTLAQWRDRFDAAWPAIAPLGFDARFKRIWQYYMSYCEAGFLAGTLDVGMYRLERS
ncbi:MAG: cfa [Rhodospirillales bacterium]|nr:cfa [Rhodospirillales bacterium]